MKRRVTLLDVMEHWSLAECDLHEVFGIDVESGILDDRSWRWLQTRLSDLVDRGPRLSTTLRTGEDQAS